MALVCSSLTVTAIVAPSSWNRRGLSGAAPRIRHNGRTDSNRVPVARRPRRDRSSQICRAQAVETTLIGEGLPRSITKDTLPVVNSHNEWSLLEEVIVGTVKGATICDIHIPEKQVIQEQYQEMFKEKAGQSYPPELLRAAAKELEYLYEVLTKEGVKVRRPNVPRDDEFAGSVKTPDFECKSQLYAAMPRDVLIVVGNELIEAPMAWRPRFFEYRSYRQLIKEYFQQGAKWSAAPKPQMSDELYLSEEEFERTKQPGDEYWVTTEFEPTFDAAEFIRMGRDLFVQRSGVTNNFGIEWMRRHLGPDYRIHDIYFKSGPDAMHLDADFVPLGPGKLLLNPSRPCKSGSYQSFFTYRGETTELRLPSMFKGWDIFQATTPLLSPKTHPLYFCSPWIATANVLSLDEKRVVVEANESECIKDFKSWGFEPIPVPLRNFMALGGSFHCATVDVRRQSKLESYF